MDRAALDAALAAGVPVGGWCPRGRKAEDGVIPDRYPLRELAGGYLARTERNVVDSDGTLIIHFGPLTGGTRQTHRFCLRHGRPCLLLDGTRLSVEAAARRARAFVESQGIEVLNVAGPRASGDPRAYPWARAVVTRMLGGAPVTPSDGEADAKSD